MGGLSGFFKNLCIQYRMQSKNDRAFQCRDATQLMCGTLSSRSTDLGKGEFLFSVRISVIENLKEQGLKFCTWFTPMVTASNRFCTSA